jgi:hypothetical protein
MNLFKRKLQETLETKPNIKLDDCYLCLLAIGKEVKTR